MSTNLDYLCAEMEPLSFEQRDHVRAYVVGAASVYIPEKKWKKLVEDALKYAAPEMTKGGAA